MSYGLRLTGGLINESEGDFRSPSPHTIEGHQVQLRLRRLDKSHCNASHGIFKACPYPDDKQRKELSRELALAPLPVKYWFQNRRTQMKMQNERHENVQIRLENETLHAENTRLKDTLNNSLCRACGGPSAVNDLSLDENHLRMENVRLKDEVVVTDSNMRNKMKL